VKRRRIKRVVTTLIIVGVFGVFAVAIGSRLARNWTDNSTPRAVGRQVSREIAANPNGADLADRAQLAAKQRTEAEKQVFWRMLRAEEAGAPPAPPLRLLFFLFDAKSRATEDERRRFVIEYYAYSRAVCPLPIAQALCAGLAAVPADARAPALEVLARSRAPEAVGATLALLRGGALSGPARTAACRLLAIHADGKDLPQLLECRATARDELKTTLDGILRAIAPGMPLESLGPVPAAARNRVQALADATGEDLNAALRYLRLHWQEAALRPVSGLLDARKSLPTETRRLALAAPALSEDIEAARLLVEALDRADAEGASAAVEALRSIAGEDFPDPAPEDVFDPEKGLPGQARAWLSRRGSTPQAQSLLEAAKAGKAPALRSLVERAEAGLLRSQSVQRALRDCFEPRTFPTLRVEVRPFIAYAAAFVFGRQDLPRLIDAFAKEDDLETIRHLLWAVSTVAGEGVGAALAEVLLTVPPNTPAADNVLSCIAAPCPLFRVRDAAALAESLPTPGMLEKPPAPSGDAAPRLDLRDTNVRWRLAFLLQHFPCRGALERLAVLAADKDPQVRKMAVYAAERIARALKPSGGGSAPPADAATDLGPEKSAARVRELLQAAPEPE
jgi:hypothetical protein